MQNFFSNLTPGGGGGEADSQPWYMKYATKGAGIGGGALACFFGVWSCITIFPLCIVAGAWLILSGVLMIACEAPICCAFFAKGQQFSEMINSRPTWQKALVYLIFAIPPLPLCFGLSTLLGTAALLCAAAVNGLLVLGPKGSKADMAAAAGGDVPPGDQENIYDNEELPQYN